MEKEITKKSKDSLRVIGIIQTEMEQGIADSTLNRLEKLGLFNILRNLQDEQERLCGEIGKIDLELERENKLKIKENRSKSE